MLNDLTSSVPRGAVPRPPFIRALGLLPPYSVADIKKAYRDKAARLHPDAGGDPEAFKALHAAYEKALEYAKFRGSRRDWLATRVERYAARERALEELQKIGGLGVLGPVDEHLEEFGRDFGEILRELVEIRLSGPHITDETLRWIDSLGDVASEVRTLVLNKTQITAQGLSKLTNLKSVRALDLRRTRISVTGIEVIERFPHLEWLHLGRTRVGYWARRRFVREHPRIRVVTRRSAQPPDDAHWDDYLNVLRRLENL